jgi:methyltransferase (TIGR00027 family)
VHFLICDAGDKASQSGIAMLEQEPSRTAFAAAAYRAAHQVVDQGRIFTDPYALPILGLTAETIIDQAQAQQAHGGMRFFIAARACFAETALKAGVEERGVEQLVVLGAGLDTFAYRNPLGDRLRIFEVDFPATQLWKRRRLKEAGIALPETLAFAPVDFERDSLLGGLTAAGFSTDKRTFFMWLGVVPYLTLEAVTATLAAIAGLKGGAEVVFDYSDPPETLSPDMRAMQAERAARVASIGEPFLTYFDPATLHDLLLGMGLGVAADLNPRGVVERFAGRETVATRAASGRPIPERGGHIILAATAIR